MSVNGINSNMLTFMHLNDKHMPVGSRDSSIDSNITISEPINMKSSTITKITIDNVPYFKKYYGEENGDIIMIMNNIDLLNNYKKSIIFNEKYN